MPYLLDNVYRICSLLCGLNLDTHGEINISCLTEVSVHLYDLFVAVIFSRIDPGGKLVMGFRKASNSVDTQVVMYKLSTLQSLTSSYLLVLLFSLMNSLFFYQKN